MSQKVEKDKKRRGYSKRAAREHPGVTISSEVRAGRKVVLLRWREVLPRGRNGKRKACVAVDSKGDPVTSRTKAHSLAVRKAEELQKERQALENASIGSDFNASATWKELFESHQRHLERKGRSPATLRSYQQAQQYLESWDERPELPRKLELVHLESFAHFVAKYKKAKSKSALGRREVLSPHSVRSILVHIKGLLNYGRKRLNCVQLSGEAIAEGLQPTVKAYVSPVALPSAKLRQVLTVARECQSGAVFPLLTFLMVTGCRLGEAEAVRWSPSKPGSAESWLDFEGSRLLIYGGKTFRQRVVPLEPRPLMRDMLLTLSREVDTKALPYVFGGRLPLALRDKRVETLLDEHGKTVRGKSGKAALYAVRAKSGADWKPKDFRSTLATYLCNSSLGLNVYAVAGELGHDHAVLVKHYAGQYHLPPGQRDAKTVEEVLGIADIVQEWLKQRKPRGGA
jgi:integrase